MVRLIREIVEQHHYRYGSPQVREVLRRDYGRWVNRKKVACLMRKHSLNTRRKRKFIPTANSNHGLPVCKNLLNRQFYAKGGGQKWVSDTTYLCTVGGWVYLTVVLDLYDRKVVGWTLSADMESVHTTIPVLSMAFSNRTPREGLIFHSDRGV
ncbi:MAG: IS3 family transposase [Treponema sp.]|nr:IS3 family transposase [Treponema sp.]